MALSREEARKAIISQDQEDTDLEKALEDGHRLQLSLEKEGNRHREAMRSLFGRLFGDDQNVPSYIAFTGMFFGVLAYFTCLIAAYKLGGEVTQFWMQQGERALAFSAACLAFIFGRGSSRES